uniref:Uncharacterized protein n=1 Tax=Rhizophora mucronata TaxID=61149 RepID=A0A2P2NA30_RHIMU
MHGASQGQIGIQVKRKTTRTRKKHDHFFPLFRQLYIINLSEDHTRTRKKET